MTAFLGIDGGGTKTEFLLIDATGRVLAAHRGGSAYHVEVGFDGLEALLADGVRRVLATSGLTAADICFGFAGLPAYGESAVLLERFDRVLDPVLPRDRYRCGNDVVCGWAGALAGADGIVVVAGTGSIAYGEHGLKQARAGGWGEMFGDEGSAFWIARETLMLFSRMSDGRMPRSAIYDIVRAYFGKDCDLDVCAAVYGPPGLTRSELAALARLTAAALRAGDAAARGVFERAAAELAGLVHAVRDNFGVPPETPVAASYCGGLFTGDEILLRLFERALRNGPRSYALAAPRMAPGAGAALRAVILAGRSPDEAFVDVFTRTHAAIAAKDFP